MKKTKEQTDSLITYKITKQIELHLRQVNPEEKLSHAYDIIRHTLIWSCNYDADVSNALLSDVNTNFKELSKYLKEHYSHLIH